MKKTLFTGLSIIFLSSYSFAFDLSGQVYNFQTKKGMRHVSVFAVSGDLSGSEIKTETDINGNFTLSGLQKNDCYTVKAFYSNDSLIMPKTARVDTLKKDIDALDFAYYPKYSVSGNISSSLIKTKNIRISFKSGEPFNDYISVLADDEGKYEADGLIYGQRYAISVASEFQLYGIDGCDSIEISENNLKDIDVIPVFYGTGRVYDNSTGEGLEGIEIKAVSLEKKHQISAKTSKDGTFILSGMRYGQNYTVSANFLTGYRQSLEIQTGTVKSTASDLNFPFEKTEK
jgi:hypothetical protein